MSIFRISLLAFFGVLIIVGTLMFAGVIPTPGKTGTKTVRSNLTVWGTVPQSQFRQTLGAFNQDYNILYSLNYKEVSESKLRSELLEAVVAGKAPDLVFFPHEWLLSISDTLVPIPAAAFSTRSFKDTFTEAGEVFIGTSGIYALPFAVDPLVLYWNRDILRNKGKINPPVLWSDVYNLSTSITDKDSTGKIGGGLLTIAMGEADNVNWFKDILSLIFLEVGDKVVSTDANDNLIPSLGLAGKQGSAVASNVDSTIVFYTNFANPTASYYTWTGALPPSIDTFIAGKLALYIGRASDYKTIAAKNPHLNFDVATVPQLTTNQTVFNALTYGSVFGMGIIRQGKQVDKAAAVLNILKEKKYADALAQGMALPPARKDLLVETQNDSFKETFYRSAEISKNWLDPSPEETKSIFKFLISDVASGRATPTEAVQSAVFNLRSLLNAINTRNKEAQSQN